MMFFLWHGMCVGIEFIAKKQFPTFHQMAKKLPPFLLTVLCLSATLPVVHWFMGDIIKVGVFRHAQMILPTIVLIGDNDIK